LISAVADSKNVLLQEYFDFGKLWLLLYIPKHFSSSYVAITTLNVNFFNTSHNFFKYRPLPNGWDVT